MARVVVVGGGFAGLAVAARLARGRHDVVLLERAAELGGSLRGHPDSGPGGPSGAIVPLAPTAFTMPAVLRDLFRKTGKPVEDVLDIAPVDPARRYVFADGTTLELPSGDRAATIAAIDAALGRGTGAEWETVLRRGGEIWEVLRRDVVEAPLEGTRDLTRVLSDRRRVAVVQPWRSLAGLGRSLLTEPRARELLGTYATAVGADPRRAPAALAVHPYLEHVFGVWHVVGGPSRLVAALAERAQLRGARLRTDAAVTQVSTAGGRVTGVRLADGEPIAADVVVVAVDVRAAAALLAGRARPWPAAPGAPRGRSRLTLVLHDPHRHPDPPGTSPGAAPVETVFLSQRDPEIRTARHVVGGGTWWTVTADVAAHDPRGTDWRRPDLGPTRAEALLELLSTRGLDLRATTLMAVDTPADLEDRTGAPGGAVHGPPPHGLRGALLRAPNRTRVQGLFTVGASAHPGPGLPFVGLSAALVNDIVGPAPRGGPAPGAAGTAA